jgi:hypothetical protein
MSVGLLWLRLPDCGNYVAPVEGAALGHRWLSSLLTLLGDPWLGCVRRFVRERELFDTNE